MGYSRLLNKIHKMRYALAHGADPNALRRVPGFILLLDRRPLHCAQNAEAVNLLIDHGALVNETDPWNNTPLHISKNADVVKALLQNGADPNMPNNYNLTPFDIFLIDEDQPRKENKPMVYWFLKYGATVEDTRYNPSWKNLFKELKKQIEEEEYRALQALFEELKTTRHNISIAESTAEQLFGPSKNFNL